MPISFAICCVTKVIPFHSLVMHPYAHMHSYGIKGAKTTAW